MKILTSSIKFSSLIATAAFVLFGINNVVANGNAVAGNLYVTNPANCVNTTTWNGTAWNNGTPQINTRVIIAGNYTTTANITACNLNVTNGAQVIITEGTTLTVENEITVATGSTLTINSNANLVQINDAAVNNGIITVKRNSSALYRLDYTLWSSPVSGQQLQAFSPATSANRFYEYKSTGAAAGQYLIVNAATTNFDAAKAYLIRMPNADTSTPGYNEGTASLTFTGTFTGTANNGIITKDLTTDSDRYTAVGNPYASAINLNDFFEANSGVLDPGAALYFWRKKTDSNASSYASLTRDAYVYNHSKGGADDTEEFGGAQWDELFNGTSSENWVINPGQGFIVRTAAGVANPKLVFNNAMRRGDTHNNQFFRTAQQEDPKSRMWLNLTGNDAFSQTAIVYSNTATAGIDYGRDGKQITSGMVSFYSIAQQTNLTIQARPAFQDNDVVTMGYVANATGTFTINLHRKDGVFVNGQNIFIKDKLLSIVHNLTNSDYTFTTEAGTFDTRFEIVYSSAALGTDAPVLTSNEVIVYKQDGAINISAGTTEITDVTVYDISGRRLYSKSNVNATKTVVSNLQVAQEVLIVELNTAKGKVSKKILF